MSNKYYSHYYVRMNNWVNIFTNDIENYNNIKNNKDNKDNSDNNKKRKNNNDTLNSKNKKKVMFSDDK